MTRRVRKTPSTLSPMLSVQRPRQVSASALPRASTVRSMVPLPIYRNLAARCVPFSAAPLGSVFVADIVSSLGRPCEGAQMVSECDQLVRSPCETAVYTHLCCRHL